MSIAGISSTVFINNLNPQQNRLQQFQQEFQQLGQDLQAGSLSAAQADFAQLQKLGQSNTSLPSQLVIPEAQAFGQLGKDLQSGDLAAAQKDFTDIVNQIQNGGSRVHKHHHHPSPVQTIQNDVNQLGQALQSGNLSAAQQAYTTIQSDLQQFGVGAAPGGTVSATA